jgi:hypothetical protein
VFAKVASLQQKNDIIRSVRANTAISSEICEVIQAGFSTTYSGDAQSNQSCDGPQFIFKHAIQLLVQQGDWGASSNLALLLHSLPVTPT